MVARWRRQFWAECMTNISEAGKARLDPCCCGRSHSHAPLAIAEVRKV